MKIIPSDKIEILTTLSAQEVRKILAENIQPKRNSFLPQIKGTIQPNINGTKIVVDLEVHTFVVVFMLFWLTFVGFALVIGAIGVIHQGTNPIFLIFPLIMIGFGIGLVQYGYNSQKDTSITDLKRIINGQIKEKTLANKV